ncbi:MAG: BTAD domain-containing putative transcriptional regulator, partial [Cryobacterium sp.]
MHIGFLGPLRVDGGGSMRPRTRTVLAALGVERGEVVSPDRLAEAVWGDEPPISWPKQVQICVWDLRRVLGADAVQTAAGGYRLMAGDDLDVEYFEVLLGRGRDLAMIGEPDRAASTFRAALDLWRGRPFEDLDGWAPGRIEAARLDELRRSAQEDLLEARLAAGEHRDVVADAEARVAEEPLRERRWALLALAQYRSGNQGEALRTLRGARRTLLNELGLDPGTELVALEAAILGQDPALLAGEQPLASVHCPYQGLAAYDIEDAAMYFGRDADVAACLDRLARVRMLVLAGPSGCGKSSLGRAGVASALRRRGVAVVVMVPGADPDTALSTALASVPGDPVVVLDQLEELFAGSRSPVEVRAFCSRLAEYATRRGRVIVTIRSDHLGDLAAEPTLARLVEEGLYLVAPLSGPALRASIDGPAAAAGLRLEPGLIELLVREAEDEPGALPLLSHALVQTWERRDGRVMTVEGYLATGEIHGAVARSAEQLYQSLPTGEQDRLRALLLRLVVPSDTGAPVRAHLDASGLSVGAGSDRMIELLVRARLLTADGDDVQLAHEAVASAWPRLRVWVDEDAVGLRLIQHLSRAADEWEGLRRPDSELYRGARLAAAVEWRSRSGSELTTTETAFLDASVAAQETEHRLLAEQSRSRARQNRRLRQALSGVAVLLVLALLAGAVAVTQRQQAEEQRRDAAITALTSDASSLRTSRRDLAALLAVQAHELRPDAESEAALFGTFTASAGV